MENTNNERYRMQDTYRWQKNTQFNIREYSPEMDPHILSIDFQQWYKGNSIEKRQYI